MSLPDRAARSAAPPAAAGDALHHAGDALRHVGGVEADTETDHGIVDWHRTGRRLRRQFLVILVVVLATWLVIGVITDGPTLRSLAELAGLGVLLAVASEIVIVGGAAVRGMLLAGERGDRLAGPDVSLVPPQVRRRLRGRRP